jgi:diguanylate cyclase (GGDEF)-like protein/PAS domain S-box-containing protein
MLKIRDINLRKRNEKEFLAALVEEKTKDLKESNSKTLQLLEEVKREQLLIEAIFNSIPGYLYVYNKKGRLVKWNKKHETMTGFSSDELSQMTLEKWFDKEDIKKVKAAVNDVFKKGYGEVEAQLILKNGEKMMTRSSGVPLILDGEKYFAGIGVDITERKKMEVQLQQNMADLIESQRTAHIGTWRLDLATNQVVWSEELYRMYGFDPSVPPPPYTEHMKLFTPESWNKLSTSIELTRTSGIPYELELKTVTSDGSNGWLWARGEAERDSRGNIISLRGAAQDITSRKKIEHEIKQSEERFQLLFEKAPLGYQSLDIEGRFIDVNQKWLDTLGYTRNEVVGKWFGDFLCPEYVEGFRQRFPIFKSQGYIHSEFEMLCKDGQRLFIAFDGKIGYSAEGKFIQTHCILQDITEQRKAEKALIESEERYRQLSEQTRTFTWEVDEQGLYTFVDHVCEKVLGYSPEDLIQKKHFYDLCPEEEREGLKQIAFDTFERKGLFRDMENKAQTKTGAMIVLSTNGFPLLYEDGRLRGYRGSDTDITHRKQTEEALRIMEERFRVAQEISPDGFTILHPVRNELGEIVDFTFVYENQAVAHLNQTNPRDVIGKRLLELFPAHSGTSIYETYKRVADTGNLQILEEVNVGVVVSKPIWLRLVIISMGEDIAIAAQDITDRKNVESELLYLSFHDHLTGVYNRRFFEKELKNLDSNHNLPLSIIMCDVNGLKLVNDSFGHDSGDMLLIKAAETIRKACREGDIVARIGGDEFIVLLPNTSAEDTAQIANQIKEKAYKMKVANIELSISYGHDTKTIDKQSIIEIIANAENHMYRHKLYERSSVRSKTIDLIMNALFEKSNREAMHSNRVSRFCESIATKMNLNKDAVNQLKIAGLIHDIGKIGVEERILNKPGRLDVDERRDIERHPEIGWRLLSSTNDFSELAQFVLNHHEKWDGSGYPNGLKNETIPLESRIIAVADAYDAMTSKRSYKNEIDKEEAVEELKRCSGSQFDPQIVEVFINHVLTDKNSARKSKP